MNNTIYLLLFSASLILATYLYLTSSKKLFSRLNALALLLSAGVMVTEWGIYNADSYHDVVYYDSFRVVFIGAVACVLGICAFLFARPFEHHPKEKLINQTVSTILVVSCMGAIFFNELEGVVTILSNKINGKWYYALHSGNFYGQFMVGWYFFILVVMSASFYLSCYKSKVDGEKKWKLGLFVGFLAYGLMMFLVFIWQPDGDSPSSFDMAPYLFVLVSGLGWVYSKFNLFELSLKDAMNEILESVSNLVIITDAKFVVKYKNELASEVLFLKKEKASYSIIQVLRGAEEIDVDKFVKKVKAL
ncbi:MAG TPA: hypothetical protein ENJ53_09565, partial [Phaeodactylibacter sp.]|nr:hypothetical protein [Phaeodactylibacter sp.]